MLRRQPLQGVFIPEEKLALILGALHYLHDTIEHGLEEDVDSLNHWKEKSSELIADLNKAKKS